MPSLALGPGYPRWGLCTCAHLATAHSPSMAVVLAAAHHLGVWMIHGQQQGPGWQIMAGSSTVSWRPWSPSTHLLYRQMSLSCPSADPVLFMFSLTSSTAVLWGCDGDEWRGFESVNNWYYQKIFQASPFQWHLRVKEMIKVSRLSSSLHKVSNT